MYDIRTREIQEAIEAADVALDHLERAKRCLSSASGWGLFDTLGGGFISGLIKHSKMSDAENEIDKAKRALEKFSKELRDVDGYSSVHINGFLTFGDLFCDGFLMDVIVQSQIGKAKHECENAINQVTSIRNDLKRML
ncbi:hypothetical protein SAMN02910276_00674 [Butyrivibrio sp. Su6]|uniref:hypothetical protein n=1 Tax=Butyrivibrio sp. Su6 TaxID=1520810 RepID=UPI00089E6BCC|nr:hypothetical protein [Butyrivibrio sp. Su6]SEF62990.1 hypothetical protein SAMN02910276_00674 [Butyrivibrio sp. Su6]